MLTQQNRPIAGLIAGIALLGIMLTGPARASQIFVQQSGSTIQAGDPNLISNPGAFNIGVNGNHTLLNPLLVVVGVFDGNGTPAMSYSGCSGGACSLATVGTYGLVNNTATMDATNSNAWVQLGLNGGGSESFANWSGADAANGLGTPTSFSLYAFSVPIALSGVSGSEVLLTGLGVSGAAPGSFVIAYSCQAVDDGVCASNGDIGQTVFTNTGLLTGVPEPAPLALLAIGLVVLGFTQRRRNARQR